MTYDSSSIHQTRKLNENILKKIASGSNDKRKNIRHAPQLLPTINHPDSASQIHFVENSKKLTTVPEYVPNSRDAKNTFMKQKVAH